MKHSVWKAHINSLTNESFGPYKVKPKIIFDLKKGSLYFITAQVTASQGYSRRGWGPQILFFKDTLVKITHFYKEGIRICLLSQPNQLWESKIPKIPFRFRKKYRHARDGVYRTISYKYIGNVYRFKEVQKKDLPLYIAEATPALGQMSSRVWRV